MGTRLELHAADSGPAQPETTWDWLSNNIAKPAYNTLVVEPHNVLANATNRTIGGGKELVTKWQEEQCSEVNFGSGSWATRTIVQGLAAIAPYAIVGIAMRTPMRGLAGALETESVAARVLRNDHTAQIAGAALYEGLRDTRDNETSFGNALGSASGFSLFALGNTLSRTAPLIGRIPALLATGAIGSIASGSVSKGWSQHDWLTKDELYHSSVSGAFMNVGLPAAQHVIGRAVSKINMSTGRGEPLDRYVKSQSAQTPAEIALIDSLGNRFTDSLGFQKVSAKSDFLNSMELSPNLRQAVAKNANTRVLETADTTAYVPAKDLLKLGPLDRNPISVTHELSHKEQVHSGELERGYLQAKVQLQAGNVDAARATYRGTRVNGEAAASMAETRVRDQLAKAGPVVTAVAATTAFEQSLRTRIENFMSPKLDAEFAQFTQTQGEFRPEQYEQRNRYVQNLLWQHRFEKWSILTQKEKLAAIEDIHEAGPHRMPRLFMRVMTEPRPEVYQKLEYKQKEAVWELRTAMDAKFKNLPASEKYSVWQDMLNGESYRVRLLAISHIEDLPSRLRLRAFNEVLRQPFALAVPIPANNGHWSSSREDFRPHPPVEEKNPLYKTLYKTPAELLVDSISSLPAASRERAWHRAFNEQEPLANRFDRTAKRHEEVRQHFGEDAQPDSTYMVSHMRQAAIRNLDVLPPAERAEKWFETFDRTANASLSRSNAAGSRNSKTVEYLLAQIPNLQTANRSDALHNLFRTNFELQGEGLKNAILSLPEQDRLPTWRKFFDRSTPEWSNSTHKKYEPDAFADRVAEDLLDRRQRNTPIQDLLWQRIQRQLEIDKESRELFETNMHGVKRGLGIAIQALPEDARFAAWKDLAQNDTKTYASELMNTVPHLPQRAQPTALRWLLNYAHDNMPAASEDAKKNRWYRNTDNLPMSLHEVWSAIPKTAPAVQPKMIREVLSMPEGELRTQLLQYMRLNHMPTELKYGEKFDFDERARGLAPIFAEAFAHAKPDDYRHLVSWWDEVSWPEDIDDGKESVVRTKLSQMLDPIGLGRLIGVNINQDSMNRLAIAHPDVIRSLAAKESEEMWHTEEPENTDIRFNELVDTWLETGSLKQVAQRALDPVPFKVDEDGDKYHQSYGMITRLVGDLAKHATPEERQGFFSYLKDSLFTADSTHPDSFNNDGTNLRLNLPVTIATKALEADPEAFQKNFLEPINTALSDRHGDYSWRLNVARELASLQRKKELPDSMFALPDLRMPKIGGLSEGEQTQLRQQFTEGLYDDNATRRLWGEGPLGRLFPKLFGFYESDGGIIGRPQHGGHEFPVDEHTLLVMQRVRENPLFETLPKKDQENTLIAAMMHDVSKKANQKDPDHEWAGASASWGVLATMGYPPVRIQRINDLIARHSQVSYVPGEFASEKFANPDALDDIVNHYRQPGVFTQLRIFNEADIRSIDSESSHWQPDVEAELEKVRAATEARALQLNGHIAPILTTELKADANSNVPAGFSLLQMNRPYALLAHVTDTINDSFLKQLNVIESPEYSVSSSLITNDHQQFYTDAHNTFALVAGPAEKISQAYRENLGTGGNVNWKRHIELTKEWSRSDQAQRFAAEMDGIARRIDLGHEPFPQRARKKKEANRADDDKVDPPGSTGQFPRLDAARKIFAQYDSLDELIKDKGIESKEVRLQQALQRLITHDDEGKPSDGHNEIKLNNPSVIGLGVLRRGKSVYLEGMEGDALEKFLKGKPSPNWLITGKNPTINAHRTVVIPKATWEGLMDRDFPLVVLDP